jgi:C-terminal processing protease CtpA/Prc
MASASEAVLRSVELIRGPSGFGFTLSGESPCVISSVVHDSPATAAGIRQGDRVLAANGNNVSRISHDGVVAIIGNTTGVLKLQIADKVAVAAVVAVSGIRTAAAVAVTSSEDEDEDRERRHQEQ